MTKTTLQYCINCLAWRGKDIVCSKCNENTFSKDIPCKRGGLYFIDVIDHPLPSVTTILQVLAKPGLLYWMKLQVALYAYAHPDKDLASAISAPDSFKNKAASKGQDIHRIIENASKGEQIDLQSFSEPWKSHVWAYLKFRSEMPHEIIATEKIVYSKKYGFAGQLDTVLKIGDRTYLCDYKTNKQLYPKDHALQLGAYELALSEMGTKVDGCAIVHLKADGTYSFVEIKPEPEPFLAALTLYNYLNK